MLGLGPGSGRFVSDLGLILEKMGPKRPPKRSQNEAKNGSKRASRRDPQKRPKRCQNEAKMRPKPFDQQTKEKKAQKHCKYAVAGAPGTLKSSLFHVKNSSESPIFTFFMKFCFGGPFWTPQKLEREHHFADFGLFWPFFGSLKLECWLRVF